MSGELYKILSNAIESPHSACEVNYAPFDVRIKLKQGAEIDTVVQPDNCVVCDEEKLDDYGFNGAPDLVVEVLSPSTAKKDYNEKFRLYEENGVSEYWIVSPSDQTMQVYSLKDGSYELHSSAEYGEGVVTSALVPEITVDLQVFFQAV